ncbi:hypothetical protein H310_00013 [Aphanomyces invadans]|uniref:Uncharacterized protein n=1 Tax=Aphanomyces invadans TaxID=157072 RepID=A0A024UUW4_9STRA|nr:hypothetical protein H310_00013 [Aphanomyces invadans]ETW09403.1 hypothetical protein H310_00013 [Aphanomyces invadans]|eukprot:XP_008860814.1 hypothetical protein H310_00013 [Aphanomyces invadans]
MSTAFNWADPRRNSAVSMKMMEKAEAARKQRLTKVKPSVSTHLNPAVEKKLPKKQPEKHSTGIYMEALEMASANESFYKSLLKFHSNQESPSSPPSAAQSSLHSPFSVHNVVATDSFFHPESEIEAFQGLKKGDANPPHSHSRPFKADKANEAFQPPPSRSVKSRADKLPALKSTVTRRDVHMTSTRSNPDLALYADPRRRDDVLDLFESDDANQAIHRSDSAPSASSTIHKPEEDISSMPTTSLHSSNDGGAVGAVVPRLNLNPMSRESKTSLHPQAKKSSRQLTDDGHDNKERKRGHKSAAKSGKKDSGRSRMTSGTSLADLRDEHKAALELLQELGGAYPDEPKPLSSRFGSKLRSTVLDGRESNNNPATTLVNAALKATDAARTTGDGERGDEVPEAEDSPDKGSATSARTSRRSEQSYDSEDFETD